MSARDEAKKAMSALTVAIRDQRAGHVVLPADYAEGIRTALGSLLALLDEATPITDQMRAVADWCGQHVPGIPTQTKTRAPGEMPSMLHWLADYIDGKTSDVFHEFAGGTYVAPSDDEVQRYATRPLDDFARAIYYLSHDTPFTEAIHHIERYVRARDEATREVEGERPLRIERGYIVGVIAEAGAADDEWEVLMIERNPHKDDRDEPVEIRVLPPEDPEGDETP